MTLHTIWDTPPAGLAYFNDGVDIKTAAAFYRVNADTDGWYVAGGRVYVPTAGLLGTERLTIELHFRPYAAYAYPDVLATPVASKTVTVDASTVGWKEVFFDTPVLMPHPLNDTNGVSWLVAYWDDSPETYMYLANQALETQSYDGSNIWRSEAVATQWNSAFSQSGAGYLNGANSPWYGIDIIVDDQAPGGDLTPPVVTTRVPASGATGIPVGTSVTVTFSESVTGETIVLKQGATPVPSTVSGTGTTRTLTPDADLDPETVYTVEVSGATDAATNVMVGTDSWSFTTAAAGAISWGATISDEIAFTGDDPTQWTISGFGSTSAQGFARQFSVNVGDTIQFALHGTCQSIDIYRIGGYDTGWRKIETIANTPFSQPAPQTIVDSNGATECSNWTNTASWTVPADAWSGMFVALARVPADAFWIPFVVRDDSRTADLVVKTSETTWGAAYNGYGAPGSEITGRSLYSSPRGNAVSFDRPITSRSTYVQTYWLAMEAPMWAFLDKQGVDWKLIASVDLDAGLTAVGNAKALMSLGHDEYWSQGMRDNAEAFRDAGGHLLFLTGNGVFWKVRFSPDRRTMWCYKDTLNNGVPTDPVEWTGTWQDTRWVDRDPGANLQGTTFRINGITDLDVVVNAATYGGSPFWRGTTVAQGTNLTLPQSLGFEADEIDPQTTNYVLLTDQTETVFNKYADDNGQFYDGSGDVNWGIVMMGYGSSVVVGFGTNQWSWALEDFHDRGGGVTPSTAARQATVNLLTDMGVTVADPELDLSVPTPVGLDTYGITLDGTPGTAAGYFKSDGTRWWRIY